MFMIASSVFIIRDPVGRFAAKPIPASGISANPRRDYIARTTVLLLAAGTRVLVGPTTLVCRSSKNDQRMVGLLRADALHCPQLVSVATFAHDFGHACNRMAWKMP
ncbi:MULTISPECIES: hypothetical protein [Lysobacteraceae]|uniref:Uncharacterized protein n=1 Tax=Agrilutibacter niabensis TaxID=380628 RepID=A0ABU1VRF6_9GAMM|nr:hypothetical protein [Lysobacter niabensis]MDR7099673.1 hypothetical protein [Lysobacter niabensis]